MGPAEVLALLGVGAAAGGANAVVGSGSLITFPTLLAFGFPPIQANVSNNVGMVFGNISGSYGYRRELAGQRGRLITLGVICAAGSVGGTVALLTLPSAVFRFVVPVLILIACVLVLVQPLLSKRIIARRARRAAGGDHRTAAGEEAINPVLGAGMLATGAYGGYFGASQGVLMIGLLGTFFDEPLQRVNGAKNVLAAVVNGVAAVVYIVFAHVDWVIVVLLGVSSTLGGLVGARYGRRLPPMALRIFIVLFGVISAVKLIFF